jgi:hypothetical protein
MKLMVRNGEKIQAFVVKVLLLLTCMSTMVPAEPYLNGSQARAFIGGRTGKIVYLKSLIKQIYFIDFSDSVLTEKKVSDDPYCWSPMIHPDGSRIVYESQSNIYIRYLQENSTQRFLVYSGIPKNGLSLEPHWWIHPKTGDEYIIYCTGDIAELEWPPKSGQTYIQKINKTTNLPDGPPSTLLPFNMASGRSKNGLWGATSHHSTGMYKLYADKVDNAFFSGKNWQDSAGWGACNGSISPSKDPLRQNRMMHLNSYLALPSGEIFENHKAIVIRSWDDPDLSHPLTVIGIPGIHSNNDSSGNLFWDHSEWATDEEYFTGIGTKVIENWDSTDIYMGRINYTGESQIKRVLKSFHGQYPHIWIKDGVLPAKIRLGRTELNFISLKKDSAGPVAQTLDVTNAGDGTLPLLEIGKLPAWLKVTITGGGTNTPKLVNTVDRSQVIPGDYSALVKVTFGQMADSALYTVRLKYSDPILTSLRAEPLSVELLPGDTIRFRVEALDQIGQPLSPQPILNWTALNALAISGEGLVKADSSIWKRFSFRATSGALACTTSVFICKKRLRIDAGAVKDSVPAGWITDEAFASAWPKATQSASKVKLDSVKGRAPEAVYRSVRYPLGAYQFDSLANGRYIVRLHFSSTLPGRAVSPTGMGVKAEGLRVLDNYSLPVRPDSGIKGETRELQVTVSDGNGLKLEFEGSADAVALSGLEIFDVGMLSIELKSPQGGETVYIGDSLHVRWQTDDLITSVGIQFSPDSGKTWIPVTRRSAVNLGQPTWADYPWVIPDSLDGFSLASEKCLLSVYDYFGTDRDRSDKTFSVKIKEVINLRPLMHRAEAVQLKVTPGNLVFEIRNPGHYLASLTDMQGHMSRASQIKGPGFFTLPTTALRKGVYYFALRGADFSMAQLVTILE